MPREVDADLASALVAALCRNDSDPLLITSVRAGPAGDSAVWANPACRALLGYPTEEDAPIVPADHLPAATREALNARLPAVRPGRRSRGRSLFLRRDGTRFRADWTLTPLTDTGGAQRWWLMSLRDASEQERLDELMAARRVTLAEQRARARLSEVIAGGAHDFNNALTVIQNMTAMVMEDLGEDTPLAEDLNAVIEAATDAGALARSLTAFGRRGARSGRHSEPFDFDLVVGQIVTVLRRALPKRIEIETDLACGQLVDTSEGMLQQLLHHLLLNAAESIPELGRIHIASRAIHDEHGQAAELTVSDDGTGRPGGRESEVTDGSEADAMMEPASVLGLLQQHGGRVHSTTSSIGTTVTVTLPATQAHLPKASGEPQALIVDDDPGVAAELERELAGRGMRCVTVDSGAAALATSFAAAPTWIIVALALGGENGIAVANTLAQRYPGAALVLTTHGLLPERVEPPPPFRHVLSKPVAARDIAAMLEALSPQ